VTARRARRTQAERRAETRQRLTSAAVELWADRPVSEVSLDLLAETAGYSRGAFHGNYDTKDAFVDAVRTSLIEQAATMITSSVEEAPDPLEALGRYVRATVAYVAEHPRETRALIAISRYEEAHRPTTYEERAGVGSSPIEDLLRQGIAAGAIRELDVRLTARVIQSALDTLVLAHPPEDPETVADQLVTLFNAAVRT
jgi:AcrR family transcriptional regulator